ncbi:MAG: MoaD/ThiS family protein [Gammaproteobacteria bacterium]|nr:MoaD/ThiS family protein [Gammaproteobacteria bacterium]
MQVSLNGMLQAAAGGATTVQLDAKTIDELLAQLVERFPDMRQHVDDGIAVAINGEIYRDDGTQEIPPDAEVFLLPGLRAVNPEQELNRPGFARSHGSLFFYRTV